MITSQQIALWTDKLRDISAQVLHYTHSVHQKEQYQKIQDIVMEMAAAVISKPIKAMEPLRGIDFSRPMPLVGGDAAIINEKGEILLIRRADNKMWAMPGGALEVGETPAEGVKREVLEETGIICEPVKLAAVHDSRFCNLNTWQHMYAFNFICKALNANNPDTPSHAYEISEMAWFDEQHLPENIDSGHVTRIPIAFRVWRTDEATYFDK